MAILDIIEFLDPSGEIIVSRVPYEDSGEFRLGSQLIVQESQVALFFRDGHVLDMFEGGRYTLDTSNLPLLGAFIGLPFGGRSPFRCYVYFFATKTFIKQGWGTPTPVLFRDSEFRMVNLRAHGNYSIRISNPKIFCDTLVGTMGMETTYAIQDFFRSIIVSQLNEVLGRSMKSVLDLAAQYSQIGIEVKNEVKQKFLQYGITLVDLIVEAITVPPEVQEMLNRATGVAAQDAGKYHQIAVSDAMLKAAGNTGTMGSIMGVGLGMNLGRQIEETVISSMPARGAKLAGDEMHVKLKLLNDLKSQGLINEADFEAQKQRLLGLL